MSFKSIKKEKLIDDSRNESLNSVMQERQQLIEKGVKHPSGFIIHDMDDRLTTIITILPGTAVNEKAIEFQEFVLDKIDRGRKNIIIEMASCRIIESTFLGAMVIAQRKVGGVDGHFRIVVDKNLETSRLIFTDLDKIFKTYYSLSEAMYGLGE